MSDAPTPNALTRAIVTARVIALDAIEGAIEALGWLADQLRLRSKPTDEAIAAAAGDSLAAAFSKLWQRWEPLAERLRGYLPQPWRDRTTPYGVTGVLVGGLVLLSLALGSGDRAVASRPEVRPTAQSSPAPVVPESRPGKLRPLLNRSAEPAPDKLPGPSPATPVRTPVRAAPITPAPIAVPDQLSAPTDAPLPLPPMTVVQDRLIGSAPSPSRNPQPVALTPTPAVSDTSLRVTPIAPEPIASEPATLEPIASEPIVLAPIASDPIAPDPIVLKPTAAPNPPVTPIASPPLRKPNSAISQTPEQKLLADLQSAIVSQAQILSQGLLVSLQANFTSQQLTAKLASGWYSLVPAQQDRLAQALFDRATRFNFRSLELQDDQGQPIARSPVIGQQMVILQRQAPTEPNT